MLYKENNIGQIIKTTLEVDTIFLKSNGIPFLDKVIFLSKNYFLTAFNILFKNRLKKSMKLFGRKYYYENLVNLRFLRSHFGILSRLRPFVKDKGVIVDIGANIGQSNVYFYKYFKAKKVYSFEPLPEIFELAKKNSPKPEYVYNFAISTKKSIKLFYKNSLDASTFDLFKNEGSKEIVVKGKKLSEIPELSKEKSIELIKIDVQGGEVDVVKASKSVINKANWLFIEIELQKPFENNLADLIKLLGNFELYRVIRVVSIPNGPTWVAEVLFKRKS